MSSSRSSSTRSSTPSKLSPPLLRQALRLIHCLQKERGASSAYSVSSQFLSNMEAARQQSDVALLLFARKDPRLRIATTLGKIRAQLDENNAAAETDEEELLITKFHRILVLFNTLIGSVVHTYILQHVNNSTCRIQVNAAATSKNQIMKRSSSVESFVPCKVPPLPSRNPRNSSVGTFGDVKNPGWTPKPNESFKEEPATAIGQSPKSAARNGSRRKIISFDAKTMESFVRPDPATCLLNLLSCFVRLKESTGLERALLSGMLSIGAVPPRLLADLILEVENQSSLVEELREQTIAEASLLQLIREGVILPLQLQELQQQILQRFNLSGIQLPSTQSVWNIITVYMDRLHSLELLLIEELESALATSPSLSVEPPRLEDTPAILQSILRDLYWEDLPSELIKSKLLEYMGRNASSSNSIIDRNIPGPISRTETQSSFGNEVAQEKSEWDINLYEIQFQKRIGRGTAGTTYLALWSGQEVAVKVAAITEMGLEGWKTETASLQRLHHPNIIRLLGSIYNPSPLTYCLVLEYCNAGDLGAALLQPAPSNFFDRVSKDMANGLAFLHSRDVIHRDIKVRLPHVFHFFGLALTTFLAHILPWPPYVLLLSACQCLVAWKCN